MHSTATANLMHSQAQHMHTRPSGAIHDGIHSVIHQTERKYAMNMHCLRVAPNMLQYFNPKAWKRLQLGAGVVEHWCGCGPRYAVPLHPRQDTRVNNMPVGQWFS